MKSLNERDQVRNVLRQFARNVSGGGLSIKLQALDRETATADDVGRILGNHSWVTPAVCDECDAQTYDMLQLGKPHDDWDSNGNAFNVCRSCLVKAIALLDSKAAP